MVMVYIRERVQIKMSQGCSIGKSPRKVASVEFFCPLPKESRMWYIHMYQHVCAQSLKLCPTLCDPMDCSSPGSFVHGILQARILEWVAPGDLLGPGIEFTSPALQVQSIANQGSSSKPLVSRAFTGTPSHTTQVAVL